MLEYVPHPAEPEEIDRFRLDPGKTSEEKYEREIIYEQQWGSNTFGNDCSYTCYYRHIEGDSPVITNHLSDSIFKIHAGRLTFKTASGSFPVTPTEEWIKVNFGQPYRYSGKADITYITNTLPDRRWITYADQKLPDDLRKQSTPSIKERVEAEFVGSRFMKMLLGYLGFMQSLETELPLNYWELASGPRKF